MGKWLPTSISCAKTVVRVRVSENRGVTVNQPDDISLFRTIQMLSITRQIFQNLHFAVSHTESSSHWDYHSQVSTEADTHTEKKLPAKPHNMGKHRRKRWTSPHFMLLPSLGERKRNTETKQKSMFYHKQGVVFFVHSAKVQNPRCGQLLSSSRQITKITKEREASLRGKLRPK